MLSVLFCVRLYNRINTGGLGTEQRVEKARHVNAVRQEAVPITAEHNLIRQHGAPVSVCIIGKAGFKKNILLVTKTKLEALYLP